MQACMHVNTMLSDRLSIGFSRMNLHSRILKGKRSRQINSTLKETTTETTKSWFFLCVTISISTFICIKINCLNFTCSAMFS